MGISGERLTQTYGWQNAPNADFAVIADDASHSLSPVMHNAAFGVVGLPHTYVAIDVPTNQLGKALTRLKELAYIGVNITTPHKEAALDWVSEFRSEQYPAVMAVNTVRFSDCTGYNTDTLGLEKSLSRLGLPQQALCLVIGAGGAGAAAVAVLHRLGFRVALWNRSAERAERLAIALGLGTVVVKNLNLAGFRLVVHATSAGKSGSQPPIDWDSAEPSCIAYDLFYAKSTTPFLRGALTKGLVCFDGVDLLVHQGAEAWPLWSIQASPPVNQMEKAVREALKSK